MRDKLIEDLKGFRTPICEGLNAKLPYAEELADYLLENGVVKRLIAQVELLADKEFSKINRTEYKKMVVSKMQERLKQVFYSDNNLAVCICSIIDQIAKEMLEGEK